jgi:hypothetical protein
MKAKDIVDGAAGADPRQILRPAQHKAPIKFLGKTYVCGVIFGACSKLEIAGDVTLIGCHIQHGVSIAPRASLEMIGCRMGCSVRVGKLATLVAEDTQFHGANTAVKTHYGSQMVHFRGPNSLVDGRECSKIVLQNCSFDGRVSDAVCVHLGHNPGCDGRAGTGTAMDVLRVDSCSFNCMPNFGSKHDWNALAVGLQGYRLPKTIHIQNNIITDMGLSIQGFENFQSRMSDPAAPDMLLTMLAAGNTFIDTVNGAEGRPHHSHTSTSLAHLHHAAQLPVEVS